MNPLGEVGTVSRPIFNQPDPQTQQIPCPPFTLNLATTMNVKRHSLISIALISLALLGDQLSSAQAPLLPFFDRANNPSQVAFPKGKPVDVTPEAPNLTAFDRAVLEACGPIGTRIPENRFRELMVNYPSVFANIKQAVGGKLRSGHSSNRAFLADLTDIWFRRQGFEHIFCGELEKDGQIGGLHFYGRYLQLQEEGIGGRLPNNSRNEEVVPGVVYTVGVVIRQGNRLIEDDRKGYSYVSSAEEMLVAITTLFKAQGRTEGACTALIQDTDTAQRFSAVFVRKGGAIVTFYPDATPRGNTCKLKR